MLFLATRVAAEAHDGQFRKGTRIRYLVHPLRVAAILSHVGLDDAVVAAAILHDTIEDTPLTVEELRRQFSPEVCNLVVAVTEPDKTAPWEDRKERTIDRMPDLDGCTLCLLCADKIDNLESLVENLEIEGEAAWERFSRGREKQRWFYTTVLERLRVAAKEASAHEVAARHGSVQPTGHGARLRAGDPSATALPRLVARLERAVERVFGDRSNSDEV